MDKLPCGFFLGARWLLFQADVISCYLSVFQPASLQNYFWSGPACLCVGSWSFFVFFFSSSFGCGGSKMQRIKLLSLAIIHGGAQHVDLRLLVDLRKSIRSLGGVLPSLVCSLFFTSVFFPH